MKTKTPQTTAINATLSLGQSVLKSNVLLDRAVQEFLSTMSVTLKQPRVKLFESALCSLLAYAGPIPIAALTTAHVCQVVFDPQTVPHTQKSYLFAIKSFLRWGRKVGHLPANIPTVADPLRVQVPMFVRQLLTPADLKAMLAGTQDEEVQLGIALLAFTGIRSLELAELTWENVARGDALRLKVWKTIGIPREIPILPVLEAWIRPFYRQEGRVFGSRLIYRIIRRIAKAVGVELKPNAFRHSYGTYRSADTQNGFSATFEIGFNGDRSWNNLIDVNEDQAREYFSLTPEAVGIADWNKRVAQHLKNKAAKETRKSPAGNQRHDQ